MARMGEGTGTRPLERQGEWKDRRSILGVAEDWACIESSFPRTHRFPGNGSAFCDLSQRSRSRCGVSTMKLPNLVWSACETKARDHTET